MARTKKQRNIVVGYGDGTWQLADCGENESPRFLLLNDGAVVAKSDNPIDLEWKYLDKIYGKENAKMIKNFEKEGE